MHAIFAQFLQGRDDARRYRTIAGAYVNDRFGAVLCQCFVSGVIYVAVGVGDADIRQGLDVFNVEFRIHGVTLGGQAEPVGFAFNHHAQWAPGAFECFSLDVHHFADITTRLDFVVHGHQYAFAASFFATGYRYRVVQVEHTVSGHCSARAHGANDDDWLVGFFNQVEEVGGLFQGIGAVGDHNSVDIFAVCQLGNPAPQLQQVVVGDAL